MTKYKCTQKQEKHMYEIEIKENTLYCYDQGKVFASYPLRHSSLDTKDVFLSGNNVFIGDLEGRYDKYSLINHVVEN